VLYSLHVGFSKSEPILYVEHHADDRGWQFLGVGPRRDDAETIALDKAIELDEAILQLADLPPGWFAFRDCVTAPWTREAMPKLMVDRKI
jgi:hypothetical protein